MSTQAVPQQQTTDFPYFTEEHDLIRQTVTRFAKEEIAPHAAQWDEDGIFPRELFRKAGDLGLFGIRIDPKWGGSGLDWWATAAYLEAMCHSESGSINMAFMVQSDLTIPVIQELGTAEQQEEFIPPAVRAYAVRGRSSSLFAPSVHRGDRLRRSIALTFDDGPSESTPWLLEILDKHSVRATFFQCGANVRRLPALAREVAAAGHEIGNHTDTHPHLTFKPPAFISGELARAQASIVETTGIQPALFRAPFGIRWFGLREAQRRLGLLGVMWTTIGVDWKLPYEHVAARLLQGARNGAIFCLHDGRELRPSPDVTSMLKAVRTVLPVLLDKGYHFERVSEIICPTT